MKYSIAFIALSLITLTSFGQDDKYNVNDANNTIQEFTNEDPGIADYISSSYGYAVFPSIGKGGIGIGGAAGKGVVFEQGTAVGGSQMTQASIGLQLGGQKYSEIIFFKDKEHYDAFVNEKFKFAAQTSAVALASGASKDAKYAEGVLIFTKPIGGLMYEASIGGQQFKFHPF